MLFVCCVVEHLLVFNAVGLGDGKADTDGIARRFTSGENDALDVMESYSPCGEVVVEKVFFGVVHSWLPSMVR